jgi:cytochrome P450
LLLRPDLYERACKDPSLVDVIVAEVARLESPVQRVVRIASRDMALGGQRIAKGERVVLMLGAANRDPAVFPRASELDPGRGNPENVAFGGGKHFCLGTSLARLEARIALGHILRMPHRLRLAGREKWYGGKTIRRLLSLPVQRREPSGRQVNGGG